MHGLERAKGLARAPILLIGNRDSFAYCFRFFQLVHQRNSVILGRNLTVSFFIHEQLICSPSIMTSPISRLDECWGTNIGPIQIRGLKKIRGVRHEP